MSDNYDDEITTNPNYKEPIVSVKNLKRFNRAGREFKHYFTEGIHNLEEANKHLNIMVSILHEEHPDWSFTRIAYYIWAANEDTPGFTRNSIREKLNEENRRILLNKVRQPLTEKDIEHSSTKTARDEVKEIYKFHHRGMSQSDVNKIFNEIPEDVDFDNISPEDINSVFKNAYESVVNKDLEKAETQLKGFDLLMKTASKDKIDDEQKQKEFQEWKVEKQQVNEVYRQLDNSVLYLADKIELSPNKLKLINNKRLNEHPELQKRLVERVSGMSLKETENEVFQHIRDLETGYIKKLENGQYVRGDSKDREIVKGGDKVVEPIQVAHIDVTKAIRQFIFRLTNQELTIDDFEQHDKIIDNTQKYRISLAKVANPRTLVSYEKDLVLAADIALDMLKLIENEFDSRNMKRDMIKQ